MNPITIIRDRIAESKRREEGVTEGQWIARSKTVETTTGWHIAGCATNGSTNDIGNTTFIASARLDLPMWRSIAERAVETLEKIAASEVSADEAEACNHPLDAPSPPSPNSLPREGQMNTFEAKIERLCIYAGILSQVEREKVEEWLKKPCITFQLPSQAFTLWTQP